MRMSSSSIEKRAGRLFCQLFPGFIEFFQLLLEGLFFVIQFHEAGNVGVYFLLREKRINFAVPGLQSVNLVLDLL